MYSESFVVGTHKDCLVEMILISIHNIRFELHMRTELNDGLKQEGHDGPVLLHWLILGNLFKTYDPEEGLKLVAMSSNKRFRIFH